MKNDAQISAQTAAAGGVLESQAVASSPRL